MKVLASVLLLFFSFDLVLACTCSNSNEAQQIENLKKIPVVFQGEVLSISEPYFVQFRNSKGKIYDKAEFIDVNFKVIRAWKGIDNPQIKIQMPAKPNSCSVHFEIGMKKTILAYGKPLRTDFCSATLIEHNKVPLILGEGKVFEELTETSQKQSENTNFTLLNLWKTIISFFS